MITIHFLIIVLNMYEPHHQKTCLRGCRPSPTQFGCHRLNCDYNLCGVMGSVLMCILSVD